MTSSEIVTRLTEALRASMAADVPLPWSRAEFTSFVQQVNGSSNEASFQLATGTVIPKRFQAALSLLEQTDSIDLVLEGLTTRALAKRDLARVLRRTLIYLTFVLFIASLFSVAFNFLIAPAIMVFRRDLTLLPSLADQHLGTTDLAGKVYIGLCGGFLLFLIATLFRGSSLLTSLMGGRGYQASRETATLLQIADHLQRAGHSQDDAIALACDVVDARLAVRGAISQMTHRDNSATIVAPDLEAMARDHRMAAANRLVALRNLLPLVLLVIVGGSAVMSYGLAVFWPVVTLLHDLTLPGGST